MKLQEIMTKNPEPVIASQTLYDAAKMMSSMDVGFLPVMESDQIVGVITDRDIVVRGLAQDKNPASTPVKEVMSTNPVCCYEDADIHAAGKLMEDNKIRRLVVCDRDDNPVGVVSLGDLASKSHEEKYSGEVLEFVSEPCCPKR